MSTTIVTLSDKWAHFYDQPHPWLVGYYWSGPESRVRVDVAVNAETGETVSPVGWDVSGYYARHVGNEGPRCVGRATRPACCRPCW